MAIHLVQRSIAYASCKAAAADSDCIVLLGEGVAAVLLGADDCLAGATDTAERGLRGKAPAGISFISDSELVALCAQHSPVVSWSQP